MENEFYFFGERIAEPNPETNFFLLDSDPTYIKNPDPDDLESDKILLRFSQRIWEVSNENKHVLTPYFSKFYEADQDETGFHIHDIFYREHFGSALELQNEILCLPTLSFRTLIFNSFNHIKFGLPLRYGRFLRTNPKEELLAAMYLSDYIHELPQLSIFEFFNEYKGYSFQGIEDYSVSYRKITGDENLMPVSCYFNQLLNHSTHSTQERFNKTLSFVKDLIEDFDSISKHLKTHGLGLEIHGQNLLVKVDKDGIALRKYAYRDLGNCTIDSKFKDKQTDLNKYYQSKYNFKLSSKHLRPSYYRVWMTLRIFFIGFLLYNLNRYAKKEKINFDTYAWFEEIINDLPMLKSVY